MVDNDVLPLPTHEQMMEFARLIADENDLVQQFGHRIPMVLVVPEGHWLTRATSMYGKPVAVGAVPEPMWAVKIHGG